MYRVLVLFVAFYIFIESSQQPYKIDTIHINDYTHFADEEMEAQTCSWPHS